MLPFQKCYLFAYECCEYCPLQMFSIKMSSNQYYPYKYSFYSVDYVGLYDQGKPEDEKAKSLWLFSMLTLVFVYFHFKSALCTLNCKFLVSLRI